MPMTTINIIYEDKAKEKWDDEWDNKKWYSEEELRKTIEKFCLKTGAEIFKAHLFIELFGDD